MCTYMYMYMCKCMCIGVCVFADFCPPLLPSLTPPLPRPCTYTCPIICTCTCTCTCTDRYRKDADFLWLRIARSEASADRVLSPDAETGTEAGTEAGTESEAEAEADEYLPYRKVAQEVLHWNAAPNSHFQLLIKQQVRVLCLCVSLRVFLYVPQSH